MKDAEIIEMAKQVGCTEDIVAVTCHIYGFRTPELIAFARLIEAATMEECAVICEQYETRLEGMRDSSYQAELAGRQQGAVRCAAAIRNSGGVA